MNKISIPESIVVPIVGDGAIAMGSTADGRVIPVLVLDCSEHREFLNLVYAHENSPRGDVMCTWGQKRFNSRYVFLFLQFARPAAVEIALVFDLDQQASLADGIVQSHGVYLQPKESGSRVMEGLDKPKILVEVSPETKLPNWDELLLGRVHKLMKREGMSRKQAAAASKEFLSRTREIWGMRMADAHQPHTE